MLPLCRWHFLNNWFLFIDLETGWIHSVHQMYNRDGAIHPYNVSGPGENVSHLSQHGFSGKFGWALSSLYSCDKYPNEIYCNHFCHIDAWRCLFHLSTLKWKCSVLLLWRTVFCLNYKLHDYLHYCCQENYPISFIQNDFSHSIDLIGLINICFNFQCQICENPSCGIKIHNPCVARYFKGRSEPRCPACDDFWPHEIPGSYCLFTDEVLLFSA